MKKVYRMENLDCANCAAKMEQAVAKIPGVQQVSVNFLGQKMTLEAEEDRFDQIAKEAVKACKKVDSDCDVILK